MQRIPLDAEDRTVLGKKVKKLRHDGLIPGHVYGHGKTVDHVAVSLVDFLKVFKQAGETGLINLRVGEDRAIPVLVRGIQNGPVDGEVLHIDFFRVNLTEKVQVPVPVTLIGEQPESVHLGETVVLQPISEIQIEALPDDLIDHVEVDQTLLKQVDDAVTVDQLLVDRTKVAILTPGEEVIIKLAPAITEEMKKLMEEQAAEAAAAQAEAVAEEATGIEGVETPGEKEAEEGGDAETETGAVGESLAEQTETQ